MKKKKNSYDGLHKVGSTVYNQRNYCGVIAVAVALDCSFGKADAMLKRMGARQGDHDGTSMGGIVTLLKEYGSVVQLMGTTGATLEKVRKTTEGNNTRYLVLVNKGQHVLTCRNGVVEDYSSPRKRASHDIFQFTPKDS
jgi:hypothetical protein